MSRLGKLLCRLCKTRGGGFLLSSWSPLLFQVKTPVIWNCPFPAEMPCKYERKDSHFLEDTDLVLLLFCNSPGAQTHGFDGVVSRDHLCTLECSPQFMGAYTWEMLEGMNLWPWEKNYFQLNRKVRGECRLTLGLYPLPILIREAFLEDLVESMSQRKEEIVF